MRNHALVDLTAPLARFAVGAVVSLLLIAPCGARADGAPVQYPSIGNFVQFGQDVQIKIGLRTGTWSCTVQRRGEGYEWQPADLVEGCCQNTMSTQVTCWDFMYDPAECAENPSMYVDCNGDDYAECCGECFGYYYYHVIDECVPPGETEYRLDDCSVDPGICEGSFTVEDTGDPCLGGDTDSDGDADTDADDGFDDELDDDFRGDGDCSCAVTGRSGSGRRLGAFALLMLAVGLGALTVSRRRR
jgi:hypothetical protein